VQPITVVICNSELAETRLIISHNQSGYDPHLIMSKISEIKGEKLNCIPNMEYFISMLVKLINNLTNEGESQFKHLFSDFENHQELLLKQGLYPYEFMDHPNKMMETELPERLFLQFNYRHKYNYPNLYLKTDVVVLADVFENF
jgi:hypothetical protein